MRFALVKLSVVVAISLGIGGESSQGYGSKTMMKGAAAKPGSKPVSNDYLKK